MSSSSTNKRGGLVLPRRRERKNSGRQQQQQQQQQTATISDDEDITVPELVELDDVANNNNNDSYLRSAQEKVVSFSESVKNTFSGAAGRQNGCLIRPRRILSSKKFELSIRRAKQQQQQEQETGSEDSNKKKPCETNSAFFKRHTDAILSNMNPQQQQQNQSASSLVQQAMAKKMALSSYGHGTNGIRVVSGKLKTLTISWLGALEGSHFGHLLRREFFAASSSSASSTLVTNTNGTNSTDSAQQQEQQGTASSNTTAATATTTPFSSSVLFAEPASKRALCCVAIRYNKGYADYMKKNKKKIHNENKKDNDDTITPLTEEEIVGNVTPFHVVGVLSMEEPVLQLTFPDNTDEEGANCATVGTEIAVFYTPGLILGVNDTVSEDEKQQNNNKKLNIGTSTNNIVNDPNSENYNPLVTPNGELRCSLCVEMTYSGVDAHENNKNNKSNNNTIDDSDNEALKVQEAALIPHDDNSWIPFRSWVAQMIREKRRKALEEIEHGRILKEQQQQQQSAQQKMMMKQDQSSGTNNNNNDRNPVDADDANAMMKPKSSSLPKLSSPLFGALKSDNFTKKLVKKGGGGGGGGELASGLDYDSSSSSSSDDDDDNDVDDDDDVDFKNFKLNDNTTSNHKPGSDASS